MDNKEHTERENKSSYYRIAYNEAMGSLQESSTKMIVDTLINREEAEEKYTASCHSGTDLRPRQRLHCRNESRAVTKCRCKSGTETQKEKCEEEEKDEYFDDGRW
jgi:hypothetical protein